MLQHLFAWVDTDKSGKIDCAEAAQFIGKLFTIAATVAHLALTVTSEFVRGPAVQGIVEQVFIQSAQIPRIESIDMLLTPRPS